MKIGNSLKKAECCIYKDNRGRAMQMDAPPFFTNSGKHTIAMPHSHRPSCTPCAKKATANRLESEKISNFVAIISNYAD